MVRTRYIGSSRAREAGFSATHKQDFIAHVEGNDWVHWADNISVAGAYSSVQAELDYLEYRISSLQVGVQGAPSSTDNAIVIFDGTSGHVLKQSLNPITIDPLFGDLIFPSNTGYNVISSIGTNIPSQAQALQIFGQSNSGGQGGELLLGSGFNFTNGRNDGQIHLYTSRLAFSAAAPSPLITQNDATGVPNDLFIISQGTTSGAEPSSLWLESGVNNLGHGGSIYLYSWPGVVNIQSLALRFDKNYPASIYQEDLDTAVANDLYITPQSIPSGAVNSTGTPGNLWLQSGYNPNTDGSGNIYLYAYSGKVGVLTSSVEFATEYLSPTISQATHSVFDANAQPLTIHAQHSTGGGGGDLVLMSGLGIFDDEALHYIDGNIRLNARDGNVVLSTKNLFFHGAISGVSISQPSIYGASGDFVVEAQGSYNMQGGDLNLNSGTGFIFDTEHYAGDDGDINIFAGLGQVNIGGTARDRGGSTGWSGSVNLMRPVFFPNVVGGEAPGTPINGVFLWAYDGKLFCKGPSGDAYQLNLAPVTIIDD